MKIINDVGSETLYNFLKQDFYDGEKNNPDIVSATTLLKPVQEIILTQRCFGEITVNASDKLWSLFGSAVHSVLEKSNEGAEEPVEAEERLNFKIGNKILSGKFDCIKNRKLYDYKVTSVWTIIYNSRSDDWIKQLSIYRWLYWKVKNVLLDDTAIIVVIMRDWAFSESLKKGNYPKNPIQEVPITLLSLAETEELIKEKIAAIKSAEKLDYRKLTEEYPCTKEERWYNAKKDTYAKCGKYCLCKDFCFQNKERK